MCGFSIDMRTCVVMGVRRKCDKRCIDCCNYMCVL